MFKKHYKININFLKKQLKLKIMAKSSKSWYKHGKHAMSVHYSKEGERYYRLEKSHINRKKRITRY